MVEIVKGNGAAPGIAIAKVYKLKTQNLSFENRKNENTAEELERLDNALAKASAEVERLKENTWTIIGEEQAEIFSAHLLILNDPEFISSMQEKIKNEQVIAETALQEVSEAFIELFRTMDNDYIRERIADIDDISKRVLSHLLRASMPELKEINEEVIIVGEELSPSETAELNSSLIMGFATNGGSRTSHTAIIAQSLQIPAVVGTKNITDFAEHDDVVIIDGDEGKVIIQPDDSTLAFYKEKEKQFAKEKSAYRSLKSKNSYTSDGEQVKLAANISSSNEVHAALENGAEGIGLYRTEFLYMEKTEPPTENEQYEAFKKVLLAMGEKPVTVRTLDIGGDKEVPYMELPKERNPFLGLRAIRLSLANENIFRPHLRALLRASVHGNLKIMFPMIATLEEFREAKAMLEEEKERLLVEGIDVAEQIDIGIMVEIPSTALLSSQFAKEVDFFSIGTNDLIQYTLATDRMNLWVSNLYQPCHPAVLRLIDMVIEAAHKEGKPVGMCGEMASDPTAVPILLGLGLDEFSMHAASILPVRKQISQLPKLRIASEREVFLNMSTAGEVEKFIKWQIW